MDAATAEVWLVSPSNYRSTVIELAVPEVVIEPVEILSKAPKTLYKIKKNLLKCFTYKKFTSPSPPSKGE